MEIRHATDADVDGIQRVARDAWHATYDDLLAPGTIDDRLVEWYGDAALAAAIEREESQFLVADESGRVLGYASGGPAEDGPGDAVLARIYVHPNRWRQGVGSALFDRLTDALADDGHGSLQVTVLAENDVGLSFYESRGFEAHGDGEWEVDGERLDERVLVTDL